MGHSGKETPAADDGNIERIQRKIDTILSSSGEPTPGTVIEKSYLDNAALFVPAAWDLTVAQRLDDLGAIDRFVIFTGARAHTTIETGYGCVELALRVENGRALAVGRLAVFNSDGSRVVSPYDTTFNAWQAANPDQLKNFESALDSVIADDGTYSLDTDENTENDHLPTYIDPETRTLINTIKNYNNLHGIDIDDGLGSRGLQCILGFFGPCLIVREKPYHALSGEPKDGKVFEKDLEITLYDLIEYTDEDWNAALRYDLHINRSGHASASRSRVLVNDEFNEPTSVEPPTMIEKIRSSLFADIYEDEVEPCDPKDILERAKLMLANADFFEDDQTTE